MVKVFECISLVLHSIVINCLTLNIDYGLSYIKPKQSRTSHVKNFLAIHILKSEWHIRTELWQINSTIFTAIEGDVHKIPMTQILQPNYGKREGVFKTMLIYTLNLTR